MVGGMKNNMYEQIVKKMGIRPEDYVPKYECMEKDHDNESPLSNLTLEELLF